MLAPPVDRSVRKSQTEIKVMKLVGYAPPRTYLVKAQRATEKKPEERKTR